MKKIAVLFSLIGLSACSIIGFHPTIHNPHRAGKYPRATQQRVLLGGDRNTRSCYDVTHYDLNVDFTDAIRDKKKPISGTVTMHAKALTDFDTLQLDLAEDMKLTEVSRMNDSKNISLHFVRKAGAVFVVMDRRMKQGELFELRAVYFGHPPEAKRPPWRGGFVRKEDKLGRPWWGVACETEGASMWWPCKDVMTDEPDSVDMHYTVPQGLMAVGNGILRDSVVANGKTNFHWHISYPINLYNVTFYIGHLKLLHDVYESPVTNQPLDLNHYVLDYNYDKAATHFQQTKKYLKAYEELFGAYAFYKDGFKLVESPYAGMEHQSAIAYGNGYNNNAQGIDYIILHETAHEWWGNSVTAKDLADGWIHEGFATYTEALYVEKTRGYQAYIRYLLDYRMMIVNRRPVSHQTGIRYFDYRDGDIYTKGAWILHSLREVINNDSLFFDILKSFATENKLKQVSSADFIAHVNRKTGMNYDWFFQQYLFNRFVPVLNYEVHEGWLYYCWDAKYTNPNFTMSVRILNSGGKSESSLNPISGKVQRIAWDQTNPPSFGVQYELVKAVEEKKLYKKF